VEERGDDGLSGDRFLGNRGDLWWYQMKSSARGNMRGCKRKVPKKGSGGRGGQLKPTSSGERTEDESLRKKVKADPKTGERNKTKKKWELFFDSDKQLRG